LDSVGAAWLIARLDEYDNWEQVLPVRAQQRLGFARALMLAPQWIFMEGATDSFDADGERQLFEALRRELPGTTLVTISFHAGLEPLHDRKIVLSRVRETKYLVEAHAGTSAPH
jgi:putative ATP-binding cassette transporter